MLFWLADNFLAFKLHKLSSYILLNIVLNTICYNQASNKDTLLLTMIMLNLIQLTSGFSGMYFSKFQFMNIEFYDVLICVLRGFFSFYNFFFYWHYCLYRLTDDDFQFGNAMALFMRECSFILLTGGSIVSVLPPLLLSLIGLTRFKKADTGNTFMYLVIPRLATYLASFAYQNIRSKNTLLNGSIIAAVSLLLAIIHYTRSVRNNLIKDDGDLAEGEVVQKGARVVWSKLLNFNTLLICYLKAENRFFSGWSMQNFGVDWENIFDKFSHFAYHVFLGHFGKAYVIMFEVFSYLGKVIILDYTGTNSHAKSINFVEIFKYGVLLTLLSGLGFEILLQSNQSHTSLFRNAFMLISRLFIGTAS